MTLSEEDKNTINDLIKNNTSFNYQKENPKKSNTLIHGRYEKYKYATNYKEFLKLDGIKKEFSNDFKNKYFTFECNINNILNLAEQPLNVTVEINDSDDKTKNIVNNNVENNNIVNNNIVNNDVENDNDNIFNLVNMIDNNILTEILNNKSYFMECIENKLNILPFNNIIENIEKKTKIPLEINIDDNNNFDINKYLSDNKDFTNQSMITYIGNKRKLINNIENILIDLKNKIGKDKLVLCDLFAGSGIVSRMMYNHSSKLITNDLEGYSYSVCKCYLDKPSITDIKLIVEHINKMNNISINGPFIEGIISENYSPKDTNNIKSGERCFYTRENALIIDTLRKYIEDNVQEHLKVYCLAPLIVKASIHNNTVGVQKGFLKDKNTGIGAWGGTDANATGRITNKITLDDIIWNSNDIEINCYNQDSNKLINEINDIDVCYLDPPYNQHPYSSNYHILDTIYKNDIDISKLSNVSGIPKDWKRSVYNKKETAIKGLTELLKNVLNKSKFAILSYNDEGIISVNELETILSVYNYNKKEIKYNTFKGSRNLKERSNKVTEIMYIISNK